MANFLKNLQDKPESIKRLIMWSGVFFVMTAIFIFWLSNFSSRVSVPEINEANINLNKLPSVWQSLKGQLNSLGDM